MSLQPVAAALQRLENVLRRRPHTGLHADAAATASWQGGTRTRAVHANGAQVETDMPAELGGQGHLVSPGWLFRSGIASCVVTCIAMAAARAGIELERLEVTVGSNSDARGLLGLCEASGTPVGAGPVDLRMRVRLAAPGVSAERLRELVATATARSPMWCALHDTPPLILDVEVEGA